MRVLIMSRQKFQVPQEQFAPIMAAFAAWRERHRPIMETFDFFVAGGGGCGIVNAPDDATLARMMMEYPWGPFSDVQLHLLMDGDIALTQWLEMLQQQAGAQGEA